jgi:hypothetical protein
LKNSSDEEYVEDEGSQWRKVSEEIADASAASAVQKEEDSQKEEVAVSSCMYS